MTDDFDPPSPKAKHPDDNRVPPPQTVGQPWRSDQPNEPITGSYLVPASMKDVKTLRADVDAGFKLNEIKTVVAIVVASLGIIFGAWRVVLSEAHAQTDAGIAPATEKLRVVAEDLAAHKREEAERHAAVLRKLERQDEKQDLILDALRVPLWKRPEPTKKDGGK